MRLNGLIPVSIFNISSLKKIALQNNSLSGSLPEDICHHLPNLEALYLGLNKFFGQIPSSINECRSLQNLTLNTNKFSGSIPKSIGNLTWLKRLYLHENNLEGKFFFCLSSFSFVKTIGYKILNAKYLICH